MTTPTIIIKKGREKPIIQQHPWIFSGAIDAVKGDPAPGDIVTVTDKSSKFLARGYWNAKSQIQVRILTWHDEPINEAWWQRMLKRAIDQRSDMGKRTAFRLINAENDYLPGLVVDRYGDFLVLQALTLHIDQHKEHIAEMLVALLAQAKMPVKGIYERSDVDVRGKEGLRQETGNLWGEEPPEHILITETADFPFWVDVRNGHKTGFYLDQFENRQLMSELVREKVQKPFRMLNLFSYTGGFGLMAGSSADKNTEIVNVDASLDALELAEKNVLNAYPSAADRYQYIQADVFDLLHDYATEGNLFDVVVLDPPKFAHNAGQVEAAARGYKDINLNAFKCIKPGGYLMTFSCSGAITPDLFQKIVFGALADSGKQAQILKHLSAGEDHPVALTFPEGEYLKGLLLKVY